ncbi:hypothetical protein H6P81_004954 [Aristolochia fimbriata]|uniref:Uncharacterized protein n=1 Tax=Aristolochia fimbriata TaxID=158543 RepID=A0AAV7EVE3_ARIFI|nr:hypothetical protein H6P81_004954 [Aristolochia fimbriata]
MVTIQFSMKFTIIATPNQSGFGRMPVKACSENPVEVARIMRGELATRHSPLVTGHSSASRKAVESSRLQPPPEVGAGKRKDTSVVPRLNSLFISTRNAVFMNENMGEGTAHATAFSCFSENPIHGTSFPWNSAGRRKNVV